MSPAAEGRGQTCELCTSHHPVWQEHTCVLHSIVGWGSTVGRWARVEGTPNDPNPNDPRAHMDSESLFKDGKLLPAITILGTRPRALGGEKPPQVVMAVPYGSMCCVCMCVNACVCVCLFCSKQLPSACHAPGPV